MSIAPEARRQPSPARNLAQLWRSMRFMSPADVPLFLQSARTDKAISRLRTTVGERGAFEAVYVETGDPWASADSRYRYQAWKYERIVACLPAGQRFTHALDLGCGLGLLSQHLGKRADQVLGIDIAQAAVDRAAARFGSPAISFRQGDVLDLDPGLDGGFDLITLADTLYYLPPPIGDDLLKQVAARMARLLKPGGLCLLANHYFFSADPESRLSRRIHDAFAWSPLFTVASQARRPFYLVTILRRT
ncbi:class I SAM-dependent methyltransferase [Nitrospirillum sp. BR 11752]|uniref:class I SAM-dependent methyltransferase n=1 Tax=Nitrospirillum sp. BR 11752 TaxID=3104293 RepID=UPI002EA73331|nr:class I SAM-dependent methyltransferase [Nitrospirillum sp. BR 11752]